MVTRAWQQKFTNPLKMDIFQMVDYGDGTGELH